jgi:hypothetical protein
LEGIASTRQNVAFERNIYQDIAVDLASRGDGALRIPRKTSGADATEW